MAATTKPGMSLLDLPVEMVEKILSYLSYDQVAKLRLVNRTFNAICGNRLNQGMDLVKNYHIKCHKAVKAKLPRRESERRHHPLSRHIDILMAVETRLSMLDMTFTKYIDFDECCFIPGKVLDEALKVIRMVYSCSIPLPSSGPQPQYPILPRPHEFLQEYRDVSSMAMEHFDEKILPRIREKMLKKTTWTRLQNWNNYKLPINKRFKCLESTWVRHQPSFIADVKELQSNVNKSSLVKKKTATATSPPSNAVLYKLYQSAEKHNQRFRHTLKKIKHERCVLNRRLIRQQNSIVRLRRELQEARAEMSVMSKDINQIKLEITPSRVANGLKRKREECEETCD
ncbi:uncharacterized protein LOC129000763 [Macrosteles quadrilineatus]|uniref:uncharacterized protein LOC129000763 n=1 Tax=Macrosteles quadrilineatus TaxID=74068 RepID=UPI0023E320E8|nr:uncharacterized protein LOC129000763 [Macrosteles quadrilineatus]